MICLCVSEIVLYKLWSSSLTDVSLHLAICDVVWIHIPYDMGNLYTCVFKREHFVISILLQCFYRNVVVFLYMFHVKHHITIGWVLCTHLCIFWGWISMLKNLVGESGKEFKDSIKVFILFCYGYFYIIPCLFLSDISMSYTQICHTILYLPFFV